jgi:hypothetical protein
MSEDKIDQYEELINEFKLQRDALKVMIVDLEKIKEKVDKILPESMDKRYVRFFEEKIKSITELFRTILDMRKEIAENAKDEFMLRQKISGPDIDDYEGVFDIRKIAQRVEKLTNAKATIEQKFQIPEESKIIEVDEHGEKL